VHRNINILVHTLHKTPGGIYGAAAAVELCEHCNMCSSYGPVGSIKLCVSFAKEPYKRDDILQKRPVILSILLTVATPYQHLAHITKDVWWDVGVTVAVEFCRSYYMDNVPQYEHIIRVASDIWWDLWGGLCD